MSQVVVFCRRWVNWLREEAELSRDVRPSDFQHEFRIAKLHERWQADNAEISLYGYRHQLQQLACRSWQASGARVIQNGLPGDAPHTVPLDPALLGELREASWVIPMDDDDWLSPGLAKALPDPRHSRHWMATWPSQLIYLQPDQYCCATPFSILPETVDSKTPVLVSCSYALSAHCIRHLNDQELGLALMQHGHASRWMRQIPTGLVRHLQECHAVHLRHQATAGSTHHGHLNHSLGHFFCNPSGADVAAWAQSFLYELDALHQKITDSHHIRPAAMTHLEQELATDSQPATGVP